MQRRTEELRRGHRRVLAWSLGIAVLLHVGVFLFFPHFRTSMPDGFSERPGMVGSGGGQAYWVDVTFGPPLIHLRNGEERQEPPERVLEAREVNVGGASLGSGCGWVQRADLTGISGTARLTVGFDGRVSHAEMEEGSGVDCVDELLVHIASSLLYRWLPDEEAMAPVELAQPMELSTPETEATQ
jgi:hypothetical protein